MRSSFIVIFTVFYFVLVYLSFIAWKDNQVAEKELHNQIKNLEYIICNYYHTEKILLSAIDALEADPKCDTSILDILSVETSLPEPSLVFIQEVSTICGNKN